MLTSFQSFCHIAGSFYIFVISLAFIADQKNGQHQLHGLQEITEYSSPFLHICRMFDKQKGI